MEPEKTGFEKIIDFSKLQISRSKILGRLLFRTARMENERKRVLQQIAEYYCSQYNGKSGGFEAPPALLALFERQAELGGQLKSHYDEIETRSRENTLAPENPDDDDFHDDNSSGSKGSKKDT